VSAYLETDAAQDLDRPAETNRSTIRSIGIPLRPRWRALLLLCAVVGLIACTFRPVVEGDGVSAYAYLHSVLVDNDLNMSDEFASAIASGVGYSHVNLGTRTGTGLVADFTPIGAALLSAPAYLIALAANPSGEPIFARPFITAYTLSSLAYGLFGLVLSFLFAVSVVRSRRSTWIAAATLALSSPLFFYMLLEPSYTHTFSEFVASAFFLLWWRTGANRGPRAWFALGLLGGLMGMIRFQDGPLAAVAVVDVPRARWKVLWYVPGVGLGFLPQLLVEHTIFGRWLPSRPPNVQAYQLWPGHYLDVLFSSHNGVLAWAPVFFVAAAGIALLRDRRLQLACILGFAIEIAMMGSQADWWGGLAFGPRRLLVLLPVFVVGLAAVIERVPRTFTVAGAVAPVAWNLVLVANFIYVQGGDRDPGYAGLLANQLTAVSYVPHIFGEGGVVRALFLWPLLGTAPDPIYGLVLLLLAGILVLGAARLGRVLLRAQERDAVGSTDG